MRGSQISYGFVDKQKAAPTEIPVLLPAALCPILGSREVRALGCAARS